MGSGYPSDWENRRKRVYERDNLRCQNCGRHGPSNGLELHAHHIVPKSKGGTHHTSNLITLCEDCHKSIHSNRYAPTKGYARKDEISGTVPESGGDGETEVVIEISGDSRTRSIDDEVQQIVGEHATLMTEYSNILDDISTYLYDIDANGLPYDIDEQRQEYIRKFGRVKLKFKRNREKFEQYDSDPPKLVERQVDAVVEFNQKLDEIAERIREGELHEDEKRDVLDDEIQPLAKKVARTTKRVRKEYDRLNPNL